jgi:hypothetical protein
VKHRISVLFISTIVPLFKWNTQTGYIQKTKERNSEKKEDFRPGGPSFSPPNIEVTGLPKLKTLKVACLCGRVAVDVDDTLRGNSKAASTNDPVVHHQNIDPFGNNR